MKPIALKKIMNYVRKCQRDGKNSAVRGFQLSYRSICNFRCQHCYVHDSASEGDARLSLDEVRSVADQFHDLNAWEVGIQGGEPLAFPDLYDLIEAIGPSRFYVCIITNGYLMKPVTAERLAKSGVDRVAVSIDGFTSEQHDVLRAKKGSFDRCLKALEMVKQAGMTPAINMVMGHYNVRSKESVAFFEMAADRGYEIVVNPATPTGAWTGRYDLMLTEEDSRYLEKLRKSYPNIMRDLWDFSQRANTEVWGDPAGNLYFISGNGDIFPHPYIFVRMGNVRSDAVVDAVKQAWKVRWFRDRCGHSIAGEDRGFVERFLSGDVSVFNPLEFDQAFGLDDLYEAGEEWIVLNSRDAA